MVPELAVARTVELQVASSFSTEALAMVTVPSAAVECPMVYVPGPMLGAVAPGGP